MPSPTPDTWIAERQEEIEEGIRQCEIALKDLDKPTSRKDTNTMNAIQKWDAMIAELEQRGQTKAQAIHTIVAKDPDLHAAYLREYNAQHSRLAL